MARQPGKIQTFVREEGNPEGTIVGEADRLFTLAQERGINTTVLSLRTALRREGIGKNTRAGRKKLRIKKKTRGKINPASESVLEMIDQAMKGLGMLKHEVLRLQQESKQLQKIRAQVERLVG